MLLEGLVASTRLTKPGSLLALLAQLLALVDLEALHPRAALALLLRRATAVAIRTPLAPLLLPMAAKPTKSVTWMASQVLIQARIP